MKKRLTVFALVLTLLSIASLSGSYVRQPGGMLKF